MASLRTPFIHFLIITSIVLSITLLTYFIGSSDSISEITFSTLLLQVGSGTIFFMLPPIYVTAYVLIPIFFEKKKYVQFFLSLVTLAFFWGALTSRLEPWMDENWFGEITEDNGYVAGISIMLFIVIFTVLVKLSYQGISQFALIRKLENDHLRMELMVLKNQINPHFLFNTLNSLYALTIQNSSQAPDVILKLSGMLRYSIYDCSKPTVQLKNEIENLENYIALQQVRLSGLCEIEFRKSVSNDQIEIAPMILIVFLENAFKHGAETIVKGAFIYLNLSFQKETLHFEVRNNFSDAKEVPSGGLGLENVKRRLALIYEDRYQLDISREDSLFSIRLHITL